MLDCGVYILSDCGWGISPDTGGCSPAELVRQDQFSAKHLCKKYCFRYQTGQFQSQIRSGYGDYVQFDRVPLFADVACVGDQACMAAVEEFGTPEKDRHRAHAVTVGGGETAELRVLSAGEFFAVESPAGQIRAVRCCG